MTHVGHAVGLAADSGTKAVSSGTAWPGVVVVVGTTGAGKSKLAVDLALEFGGEVVSADSMQLYSGLPIVTNAVTEREMLGVPHHLVGCVPPGTAATVHHFVALALPAIEAIRARGKLVVVVGGTNYYIEAVLFRTLHSLGDQPPSPSSPAAASTVDTNKDATVPGGGLPSADGAVLGALSAVATAVPRPFGAAAGGGKTTQPVLAVPVPTAGTPSPGPGPVQPSLHAQLAEIDPLMAVRLHPNDARKIARSIEVYQQTGVRHSELVLKQPPTRALRYSPAVCFWIGCDQATLDARLDARVDAMIEAGLVGELNSFRRTMLETQPPDLLLAPPGTATAVAGDGGAGPALDTASASVSGEPPRGVRGSDSAAADGFDYAKGVLQAIGFKEFQPYFRAAEHGVFPDPDPPSRKRPRDKAPPGRAAAAAAAAAAAGIGQPAETAAALGRVFAGCVGDMKRRTRRYARKQTTWVNNRLAARQATDHRGGEGDDGDGDGGGGSSGSGTTGADRGSSAATPGLTVYKVDASDPFRWDATAKGPALGILRSVLAGEDPGPTAQHRPAPPPAALADWKKHVCERCNGKVLNGDHEWQAHLKSKRHRKRKRHPGNLAAAAPAAPAATVLN